MAGKNGGARPGAGRKKAQHTIESEEMRKQIIARVGAHVEELMRAQLDLALGHVVMEKNPDGTIERVYTKSPDAGSGQYLLNQAIGKPSEQLKLTDPEGNAISGVLLLPSRPDISLDK